MLRVVRTAAVVLLAACSTAANEGANQFPPQSGGTPARAKKAPAPPALGPDTRDYDQEDLALDLDLDLDHGTLSATATHTMTALADLSQVRMHLADMTVVGVTSDGGATCTASQADDVLTVALDRPRKKGERFTLAIRYGGKPKSGLWFFKPTPEHPEVPLQVWSQGEEDDNRHWIPCYDLPDDRLTSSVRVVVPAGLQTLSNGKPTGTQTLPDGRVAHSWVQDRAHVTYLITLVVGTFDDVKRDAAGVEQHDLVPPGWGPWCDEVFGRTPDVMAFYQDFTGQPFPWARYSQVTVWDFHWGGMENTSATTLNMRALHKEGVRPDYSADGLVAHELAHDWFGDLVTCRTFNHIWLNEGFATYFTDLWDEHHNGPDDFAVDCLDEREGYMNGVDLKATAEKARPEKKSDCADLEDHPYVKGASVLNMLRKILGDDVFRRAVQRYVRENRDRSVESEALRAALEAESGQDLKGFFDQWVYGSGFPELNVATTFRGAADEAHVVVQQVQPVTAAMPVFVTPLDLEVHWPEGSVTRERVQLARAQQEFVLALKHGTVGAPEKPWNRKPFVRVDPDHWLLARIRELKPRDVWEEQLAADASNVGRMLAARALAEFGAESVPSLAKAATADANRSVRAEACTALGKIHDDAAAKSLVAAAEDVDSRVRRAAMNAMAECKAELVAPTLRKHFAEDPSVYVAADAAAALGKTKDAGAFDALVAGLSRESHRDQIRQRVMDGLKALGDKRGAEVAMRHLDYSWGKGIQHELRHAALDAMIELAPEAPLTRAWIVKLLPDPYFRMQRWAAEAAVKLKIGEALPVMLELSETEATPGVKDAMRRNAESLRDALVALKEPKSPEEAKWIRFACESKMHALETERAKLSKELEEVESSR
jgi:aminopeptidase N